MAGGCVVDPHRMATREVCPALPPKRGSYLETTAVPEI